MNPKQNSGGLTDEVTFPKITGPNPNTLFANSIADNFKSNFTTPSIEGLLNVLNVSKADLNLFANLNSDLRDRAQ